MSYVGPMLIWFGGLAVGYWAAITDAPKTPTHAYIQGQQDTLNDCREFGVVQIAGNPFQCTGEPTQ